MALMEHQPATPEVVTYLEMTDPSELRPSRRRVDAEVEIRRHDPDPELNEYLYTHVGKDWFWIDRLIWIPENWLEYVSRSNIETWVLYAANEMAGYFELNIEGNGSIEIAYFGLLPEFVGKGLGGYLLSDATQRAWDLGASHVWLHTSSRDHPNALANYEARGFRIFKREVI